MEYLVKNNIVVFPAEHEEHNKQIQNHEQQKADCKDPDQQARIDVNVHAMKPG
jgi:hypothetical protein